MHYVLTLFLQPDWSLASIQGSFHCKQSNLFKKNSQLPVVYETECTTSASYHRKKCYERGKVCLPSRWIFDTEDGTVMTGSILP